MKKYARLLKPGASRKTHVLTAALIWSAVGLMLVGRGIAMHGLRSLTPVFLALAVGTLKALLILDRTAVKNIRRIMELQDGACLGGVYSWKMWLMIVFMVLAGRGLRLYGAAPAYVGLLYVAVGWALLFASRKLWQQYLLKP